MEFNSKVNELNNQTKSEISFNIYTLIREMTKKANNLEFISNGNDKSLSALIKTIFMLSFKISNKITDTYIEILRNISDFLKSEHIDDISKIINHKNIEIDDAIDLTRSFLTQTKSIIDFESNVLELILNIIAYDSELDDHILNDVLNILPYDESINSIEQLKNILKEYSSIKKRQLLNSYIEELYLLASRFDDAKRSYFENYLRSCSIILYLYSEDFSSEIRENLNSIINQFNLLEIDDEIDQYFKKNGLDNNRFKAMLNSSNFFINLYNNSDLTTIDLVYKILLIALSIDSNINQTHEKILNELTLKGGIKNEYT